MAFVFWWVALAIGRGWMRRRLRRLLVGRLEEVDIAMEYGLCLREGVDLECRNKPPRLVDVRQDKHRVTKNRREV